MVSFSPGIQAQEHSDSNRAARPVPADLREAVLALDTLLNEETKAVARESPLGLHIGTGTWIRNNWLGKGSSFYAYLRDLDLGLSELDGMSSFVLGVYSDYLNTENPDAAVVVERNVARRRHCQQQWDRRMKRPEPEQYPEGANLLFSSDVKFYNKDKESLRSLEESFGFVHLARDTLRNRYWLYDYDKGWAKVGKRKWNSVRRSTATDLKKLIDKIYRPVSFKRVR